MGEYAIRKSDGQRVKIGTCESMYYLRYEDRNKVTHESGNVDPMKDAESLRFRLPFLDEDEIQPGDYEDHNRGLRLYRASAVNGCSSDFEIEAEPGIMQLRHESGLLLNVPCYHGAKLPEVVSPMKAFWNGKSWSIELYRLRPTPQGIKPIIGCRHCGEIWRVDWADIWEYIPFDMRCVLRTYQQQEQAEMVSA
jgi:hypothetical protein